MIRTQVSLNEEEYEQAKKEAKRQGLSLAEYFRRALRKMLPLDSRKRWMRFRGLVESGNPRSSREIDDVYDAKE